MKQRIAVLLLAAALTVSVAGCGSDGSTSESTGQPLEAASGDADADVAGEVLALGRRAEAPFVDYGAREQPTRVGVRVLAVRKGDIADLKHFSLDRKQRRSVPYYVDAKFENLGDFALTRNLLRASIEDADGPAAGPELHRLRGRPAAQARRA